MKVISGKSRRGIGVSQAAIARIIENNTNRINAFIGPTLYPYTMRIISMIFKTRVEP